jgi:hypothetical protein
MAAFWQRLFGAKGTGSVALTLLDYAENYLYVFEVASHEEKTRHATELFEAANATARHVGANDFIALIERADVQALGEAAAYSRKRFDEMTEAAQGRYWLSAYALTHLMILNSVKSFEDTPRAKLIATNAAHLFSAAYAGQSLRG